MKITALDLEEFLLDDGTKNPPNDVPAEAVMLINNAVSEGYPTALGKHDSIGYFIMHCGQGPFLAWQEKPWPE